MTKVDNSQNLDQKDGKTTAFFSISPGILYTCGLKMPEVHISKPGTLLTLYDMQK